MNSTETVRGVKPLTLIPVEAIIAVEPSQQTAEWQDIAEDMVDYIDQNYKKLFVTSNMCGINSVRVIAIPADPYVMFNPRLVFSVEELELKSELSPLYPGMSVKIKRPTEVRIRFQDMIGVTHTKTFNGMTARYLLQAMDILDGNTKYYNKASSYHKELALKKYNKNVKSTTVRSSPST